MSIGLAASATGLSVGTANAADSPDRAVGRDERRRPNLLFIMCDQQRFDALGANGNRIIKTPNLDALAAGSANLKKYFVNSPVCVPSRCNMFTGRYPHSHRIRENHSVLEYGREIHLFRALKQAGYHLGYVGKNHLLETPEFENFDFHDIKAGENEKPLMEWYAGEKRKLMEAGTPELWRAPMFHDFPEETTSTGKTGAAGIRYLKERDKKKPFCLCVSFHDPHVPHLAPRKFEKLYPPDALELYGYEKDELSNRPSRYEMKWRAQKSDRADDAGRRHYMAVYYAMISWIDEQVGKLLAELDGQGIAQETIVVFTTDHGEFCFEHNMFKKDLVLLDSLLHVPCLMRWPGKIVPRAINDTLIEQVDLMPTLLELMGVETPLGVQGSSFASLLKGERSTHKDAVYAEICPPWLYNPYKSYDAIEQAAGSWEAVSFNVIGDYNKSIREDDWRYVWFGTGEEELYDHRVDPNEFRNLANDPAYAQEKMRLKLRLLEWVALSEDPLDPLTIRQLQTQYSNWKGAVVTPGPMHGPKWLEQRTTAAASGK